MLIIIKYFIIKILFDMNYHEYCYYEKFFSFITIILVKMLII